MTETLKNVPASVRHRLFNIHQARGGEFQLLLQRYAIDDVAEVPAEQKRRLGRLEPHEIAPQRVRQTGQQPRQAFGEKLLVEACWKSRFR